MNEELETHIGNLSNMLNGQIRGGINQKARDENLALIKITLNAVFELTRDYMISLITQEEILLKLKKELNADTN